MTHRIIARLIQGVIVIWAIYTVTFVLVITLPGTRASTNIHGLHLRYGTARGFGSSDHG